jgi:hypothetical protein
MKTKLSHLAFDQPTKHGDYVRSLVQRHHKARSTGKLLESVKLESAIVDELYVVRDAGSYTAAMSISRILVEHARSLIKKRKKGNLPKWVIDQTRSLISITINLRDQARRIRAGYLPMVSNSKSCTCSKRLRDAAPGVHSGDCPFLNESWKRVLRKGLK